MKITRLLFAQLTDNVQRVCAVTCACILLWFGRKTRPILFVNRFFLNKISYGLKVYAGFAWCFNLWLDLREWWLNAVATDHLCPSISVLRFHIFKQNLVIKGYILLFNSCVKYHAKKPAALMKYQQKSEGTFFIFTLYRPPFRNTWQWLKLAYPSRIHYFVRVKNYTTESDVSCALSTVLETYVVSECSLSVFPLWC